MPRAHDEYGDDRWGCTPPRRVVSTHMSDELEEAGVAVVDGDVERYRDDEFNVLDD
jgi:H2-forming N5,N10-methylenetetrahydromethanopterin dehydrogenase-like enzyme